VELMGKEKGYNSSKVLRKLSQWFIKGFQNGMMEGKKMESFKKGFWCWSVFLLSKYWLPFYLKRFLELFSLSLSLFLHAPSLEDLGVLMILEEKIHFFKNFFSNEMVWTD
jgi:hypothetical protein